MVHSTSKGTPQVPTGPRLLAKWADSYRRKSISEVAVGTRVKNRERTARGRTDLATANVAGEIIRNLSKTAITPEQIQLLVDLLHTVKPVPFKRSAR